MSIHLVSHVRYLAPWQSFVSVSWHYLYCQGRLAFAFSDNMPTYFICYMYFSWRINSLSQVVMRHIWSMTWLLGVSWPTCIVTSSSWHCINLASKRVHVTYSCITHAITCWSIPLCIFAVNTVYKIGVVAHTRLPSTLQFTISINSIENF